MLCIWQPETIKAQPELVWCLTPSTGINVVNKINLLRKSLLRYQYFNNGIKSKKVAFFDFGITTWKTTNKWQKEGCFTTSVPVDPQLIGLSIYSISKSFNTLHVVGILSFYNVTV